MSIHTIFNLLNQQNITAQQGQITFNFAGISFPVTSKDIVGGVLQEWFENWMRANNIPFTTGANPQEPPDFYLSCGEELEIKAFNFNASPAFDLANFDAYTRALLVEPTRLDAEHLIFGYVSQNTSLSISNIWVKKIWEMTGPSPTNCLNLQVKQNKPTNIRPKDWRGAAITFSSRRDFVIELNNALIKFHPTRYHNWILDVEREYLSATGNQL
mgnify:CR=1 FL=1